MNIDDIAFIAPDMEVEQEYENAQRLESDAQERMLLEEEDLLSDMSETSEMSFDDTKLVDDVSDSEKIFLGLVKNPKQRIIDEYWWYSFHYSDHK